MSFSKMTIKLSDKWKMIKGEMRNKSPATTLVTLYSPATTLVILNPKRNWGLHIDCNVISFPHHLLSNHVGAHLTTDSNAFNSMKSNCSAKYNAHIFYLPLCLYTSTKLPSTDGENELKVCISLGSIRRPTGQRCA